MRSKVLALVTMVTLLGLGAWSFGCSSSSDSGGGPNASTLDGGAKGGDVGGGTGDAGRGVAPDAGPGDAGGTGNTGTSNPDQACAANGADADTCSQCCIDNHMTGQRTFITAVHTCECANNGPCRSQCGNTFCASSPQTPDPACINCMERDLLPDAGTSCYRAVSQACGADQDCVAEQNCFGICQ